MTTVTTTTDRAVEGEIKQLIQIEKQVNEIVIEPRERKNAPDSQEIKELIMKLIHQSTTNEGALHHKSTQPHNETILRKTLNHGELEDFNRTRPRAPDNVRKQTKTLTNLVAPTSGAHCDTNTKTNVKQERPIEHDGNQSALARNIN